MGAKRTSELIPLCHPLALTDLVVAITPDRAAGVLRIRAEAATTGQTGVEMEAMTAASVAALTIYDMVKGVERGVEIRGVRLVSKTGGKSGTWIRQAPAAGRTARPGLARAPGSPVAWGRSARAPREPPDERAGTAIGPRHHRERRRRRRRPRGRVGRPGRGAPRGARLQRRARRRAATTSEAIEAALVDGRGAPPPRRDDRRHRPDPARRDAAGHARPSSTTRCPGSPRRCAPRVESPRRSRTCRAAIVGVRGRSLIVNLPGSPKGALESLDAIAAGAGPRPRHPRRTVRSRDHGRRRPGGREASADVRHRSPRSRATRSSSSSSGARPRSSCSRWRATCGSSRSPGRRARSPTSRSGSSAWSSTPSSSRRCSRTRVPRSCTPGIFWGFVLLTIGTANIVTGGIIQESCSIPADGLLWTLISAMQNIVAVHRPVLDRLGVLPPAGHRSRARLTLQPRRADHPRDDRRRRRDRALRAGLRGRGPRRHPGCVRLERARDPAEQPLARRSSTRASRSCGGATSRSSPRSSATCRSASTCTSRRPSRTSTSASSRRAASCRSSTSRTRTRRSGSRRSRTSAGRTCSTGSPAPNAAAARRPARPTTPASRSTPRN